MDLCRLARELASSDVRLALVGGYGLLLEAEYIRKSKLETVGAAGSPRATDRLNSDAVDPRQALADLPGKAASSGVRVSRSRKVREEAG